MTKVFNRHQQKDKRQTLRNSRPPAEVLLWLRLRDGQVAGCRFRRQYSVGPYVLDFYCPRLKLAIEIDGPSHDGEEVEVYDANRQALIESYGIHFLRFTNEQVYNQLNAVLETIAAKAEELR
ncbi:MAG: endonuclease domain-containing protein [Abitibacteriaceae bacterium]|nr:endonuclease domain-containing protein [Abditibacteriaceae bacterium]